MGAMAIYVRVVDAVNYRIGRVMMWGLFGMMAILLWSSISKTCFLQIKIFTNKLELISKGNELILRSP